MRHFLNVCTNDIGSGIERKTSLTLAESLSKCAPIRVLSAHSVTSVQCGKSRGYAKASSYGCILTRLFINASISSISRGTILMRSSPLSVMM